ncbi:MAG: class I SAM-dependent methyltransferase [Gammaproteobacteria bacterium]|nr:class I SAM-dependent methyltransferase [Gammaproteobacteria bacterium]
MPGPATELLAEVAAYYAGKLAEHGPTPRGVDWNGEESQHLRFEQLCRIVTTGGHFSINDIGCGYGALLDHLATRYPDFSYTGLDVSAEMVQAATIRHHASAKARFVHAATPDASADYGVASGILNVRLNRSDDEWRTYVEQVLDMLDRSSTLGFAFNCLTSYSDADRKRDHLWYADPCVLFDLCKRRYSRQVALLHDYGLYEFTILVRKQA